MAICYKDKTFCITPGCKNACGRQLTYEIRKDAMVAGLPICSAYFCDPDGTCSNKITVRSNDGEAKDAGAKVMKKYAQAIQAIKNLGER